MPHPLVISSAYALAKEYFPVLVSKIAGPGGEAVAEKVVETASAVAGLPPDADPSEMIAAINGQSEGAQKLQYELEVLNQQEHARILEDRADARAYRLKADNRGRWRGDIMLAAVSVGLFLCIFTVWFGFREGTDTASGAATLALITTIAGALLKMLSDAFAFEFGSSRGSKNKDQHIEELQQSLLALGQENRRAEQVVAREKTESSERITDRLLDVADRATPAAAAAAPAPQPVPVTVASAPASIPLVDRLRTRQI